MATDAVNCGSVIQRCWSTRYRCMSGATVMAPVPAPTSNTRFGPLVLATSAANAAADVVSENAAIDTRVGITARAVDGDATVNTVSYALIDADFAKQQLLLLTREWTMHPNGQMPAYEWNFGDVNPPVHPWATILMARLCHTIILSIYSL